MNRRSFRTLRLPGGRIQGTKGLENYIGATQQTAPFQEEEGKRKHNEEDPTIRQGASDATASAARHQDLKLANDYLDCKKISVALARKRTIPTERPPPVGEVSANFCG